jgi:hypothetical protein
VADLFDLATACRDLVDPTSAVPDALVDAVKKEMQKNQRVQPGEIDEGALSSIISVSLVYLGGKSLISLALLLVLEEIRKALKAMNLLKVLEGKEALGNKSNTKDIGEHKVRSLFVSCLSLLGPSSHPPSTPASSGKPNPSLKPSIITSNEQPVEVLPPHQPLTNLKNPTVRSI